MEVPRVCSRRPRASVRSRPIGSSIRRTLGAACASACAACSLDLDASLINRSYASDDAGVADATAPPAALVDAALDAAVDDAGAPPEGSLSDAPAAHDAVSCASDADCAAAAVFAGACVASSTCDTARGQCSFQVCPATTCAISVCDRTANSCSAPKTYGFAAGRFQVPQGLASITQSSHAIAAVNPFLFLLGAKNVLAYNIVDPTAASPPPVPVLGVPFPPASVMAVGRRVYFVGSVGGSAPSYNQGIAWVDVPNDPFVSSFQATSVQATTTTTPITGTFGNGGTGMYFVYGSSLEPTALAAPPFGGSPQLTPLPNTGLATGATVVASSGSRLVANDFNGTSLVGGFALITGPGTATASAGAEQATSDAVDPESLFGSGDDGSVLWTGLDYPSSTDFNTESAFLAWVLADASATTFDLQTRIPLETYATLPPTTPVLAPPGWIDSNTALALASAAENIATTSVQIATRQPPALRSGVRTILSASPDSVDVATSAGVGYVAAVDATNSTSTVYVFAPSCAP